MRIDHGSGRFDHAYAAGTEFGRPLVDSTFTLALVTGQSTIDLSLNVMANLGWDEVRLPNPVFEGDTIYSRCEVLETRESRSRPNVGIVRVRTTGDKQNGTIVIEFLRTFMEYKRGQAPGTAWVRMPEPKRQASRSRRFTSRSEIGPATSQAVLNRHNPYKRVKFFERPFKTAARGGDSRSGQSRRWC